LAIGGFETPAGPEQGNAAGVRFWDPLINLLSDLCQPGDFTVASELEDILPAIRIGLPARETAAP
jgi:hypothetical protein